ncbi:phenylacetate--CoA ligase family protein [Taibaiella koreensis]|uniref:phenylacetate--CoA ligase family protein n=1 Tax=Taibaiella koreensis TaxID=1268548 RepID=UPI000E599132|nr:AMP-binding protein [Taibaiella koreensis]
MSFIPAIEQKSIAEQAAFQWEKLGPALEYLLQHSPYYRRMFGEQQIDVKALRSWEDFARVPTTSKEALQQYNNDFLCVAPKAVREYMSTSGTLGRPVTIALTQNDLLRLAYNEYLSFHCIEATDEDIFQLMLTLDRQFMAGVAYYSGLSLLGAASIRTGPGLPAMQWDTIRQMKTTGLVAVPSFLLKLIAHAKANDFPAGSGTVKKVLAIGESLRDEELQPNALARQIAAEWDVQLYSTYAATELQTAFTECRAGQGGHHHPELVVVELLDDRGQPVAPGEKGEVTITTLGVEGMPLLRYRTGDMCRGYYEPCSCGRHTMRLGPVLGRKQQMIKFKGTTLYPPAIFDVLNGVPQIQEYVIEISTGADGQDELAIYLHCDMEPAAGDELLRPLFSHRWRVVPRLHYRSAEAIRQLQYPGHNRKPVKLIDLRHIS